MFFLLAVAKGKTFPSPDGPVPLKDCIPNPLFSLVARKNYRNKLACHTMLSMGLSPLNDPFDFDFDEKQDDPCSEDLAQLILCPDCKTRSKVCPNCKLRNSPLSLVESKEDQVIFDSISVIKGEKSDYVMVDYPFPPHFPQLYHHSKSNIHLAEKTTNTLF